MAGHKAAVFCRRMNTWTLLQERENRRERRDTLNYLEKPSPGYDENTKSKLTAHQRNKFFESENPSVPRNKTANRVFSSQRVSNQSEAALPLQPSVVNPSGQHQSLPNVYPFILPRQRSALEKTEDRRGSRQNFSAHNASREIFDDNSPYFGFVSGRSSVGRFPEFSPHLLPSGLDNGTVLPSTKHTFIPLKTNRPLIIPSISVPGKFSESNLQYGSNQLVSPDTITGGYGQNTNSFHTQLSRRGESLSNYPPFQQLPPEAFILPLTRSTTVTTAPFIFSNRLGYELVHPSTSNNTVVQTDSAVLPDESAHEDKSVPPIRSLESSPSVHSQSIGALNNHVSANLQNKSALSDAIIRNDDISLPEEKSFDHQVTEDNSSLISSRMNGIRLIPPERSHNETEKDFSVSKVTSTGRFDNSNIPSVERGDLPVDVPRWYPEFTKQITIPLDIEVLHHREEYTPNISNRTEEVNSIRSHETEDHTFLPSANTVIPIPVVRYSNGLKFDKEVKLLPQVSHSPVDEDLSKDTLKFTERTNEKQDKEFQPGDLSGRRFPIYSSDVSNTTLLHISPSPFPPFANNTETLTLAVETQQVSGNQQDHVSQIPHPKSSHDRTGVEDRWITKEQQQTNEGPVPVHDFKIDEGVPSYRKRYPSVTQLFTPEETVGDIGRLPNQQFSPGNQNPFRRRRPSAFRNKTHSIPPHRSQSATPWRKSNQEVPRSFVSRQQTRFSDQGITFHQRGFTKAGVPDTSYDHHRKRFGVLPPGVSVHPRHPQAPYADLALGTVDQTIPVNPRLQPRLRRVHLRHHRRHQRKRNRVLPSLDSGLSPSNCCGTDGLNCCSGRRRGRHSPKGSSQTRESRRQNSVLPPQNGEGEVAVKKQVQDVEEDRCMEEKMCRTVYQSTKKVFVCRNIEVDGC